MADDHPRAPTAEEALTYEHYGALARFRFELRRFLVFSEAAAAREGLPAQQHQALLAIAGRRHDSPCSVGDVAQQLLITPHAAAELVGRMVTADLLSKASSPHDRRRVELRLTDAASTVLARLTAAHLQELTLLERALGGALWSASGVGEK